MEKLYNLIEKLTSFPGISGREDMAFSALSDYIKGLSIFDETGTTEVGSFYGIIKCGKKDAPTILCDAHLDTIGFVVSEICEGGFLRVSPVGGVAAKILSAAPVNIYGKKTIRGVFASVPPHLQAPGESEKKQEVSEMLIDSGMSNDSLKELVSVGTPVGFPCELQKLFGNCVVGAGFDDRLCGAVMLRALMNLDKKTLSVNVAFQFSGNEETGYKGAMTTAYRLKPNMAIVMDVTHAFVPGAPKNREGTRAGKGCDVCLSPQTNRAFTKKAITLAREKDIPIQLSAAPGRTGTNSGAVQTSADGIPTLLISVPLKNMHTANEIVDLTDALSAYRLVETVIRSL